ncbi:MAG: Dyp-type peroxidase [Geodermatophilaceae bacterium]|nr:Dyp-type peroxidase [Geodermatophilaceae bacterium]
MLTRRGLLTGAAAGGAALGAGGLLAGCTNRSTAADVAPPNAAEGFRGVRDGARQAGILAAGSAYGLLASFRTVAEDRGELVDTMRAVSAEIELLGSGERPEPLELGLPPSDNGVLDGVTARINSATVSVGASLFDDRYGLAERKPAELVPMTRLANDRLDPARTHGDLLLVLQAAHPDVCVHALRRIMRETRGTLVMHWLLDTFTRPDEQPLGGQTKTRNLMGFKDGTANPGAAQDDLMDEVVWVRDGDGEPAWAIGGSYQAVRIIRMFVEHWDRTTLREQEAIMGRHRGNGAPLGDEEETDIPNYVDDPAGETIPLDAHIRLANPRDGSPLMLRRGFNFARGVDGSGQLDQGLAFISYQRRLDTFLQTQERLAGEPLEEYVVPEGGGFFFALPGPGTEGWLGQSLLES